MTKLINTPEVSLGIVGVSRDCFPAALTKKRLDALMAALKKKGVRAHRCAVIIENEHDAMKAVADLTINNCNAAVVYLGNFGPEGPTTIFMEHFHGPSMVCAAAEENKSVLKSDRGDALCGMLNCSYSLHLRGIAAYIPQEPVGLPAELVGKISDFISIARVVIGVLNLKIMAFGPRPQDFFACNAPIQPLYDIGVEVMENSELDLLQLYKAAGSQKSRIKQVAGEMQKELGRRGNTYPDLLTKLAQYEIALLDFMKDNLGSRMFGVFAGKCWPSFEGAFGFVPCYVNSRLAGRGIPAACEVDMYGALSEYMLQLATMKPATLLDINNSVPGELVGGRTNLKKAAKKDLFMGFHCGNTCSECMKDCRINYQVIMNRLMEGGRKPDITRGTLEGQIKPGPTTMFRLQSTARGELRSYIAEGEMLDIKPCTFGGTGIVAIPGFSRFYRHILIGKGFPHHGAFGFSKVGRILFEAVQMLGIDDIGVPLPDTMLYAGENPFEIFKS